MCFGEMSFLAVFFSGEDWLQHQINSDEVVVEKWLTPPKKVLLIYDIWLGLAFG
jgi:hypothetical protein